MLSVRTEFHLMNSGSGEVVAEIKPVPRDAHDVAEINAVLGCLSVGAPDVKVYEQQDVMIAHLAPDVKRESACAVLGSVGCKNVDE